MNALFAKVVDALKMLLGIAFVLAMVGSMPFVIWRMWSAPKIIQPVRPAECSAKVLSALKAWPVGCARLIEDAQEMERAAKALSACAHEHDDSKDCDEEAEAVESAARDYHEELYPPDEDN